MTEKTREKIIAKLATVKAGEIYVLDEIEADALIGAAEVVTEYFPGTDKILVEECDLIGPRLQNSHEIFNQLFQPVAALVRIFNTTEEEVAQGHSRPTPDEMHGMIMSIAHAAFGAGVHAARMAEILWDCVDEEELGAYTKIGEQRTLLQQLAATIRVAGLENELRHIMEMRRKRQEKKAAAAGAVIDELMGAATALAKAEDVGEEEYEDDPRSEDGWLERSDD